MSITQTLTRVVFLTFLFLLGMAGGIGLFIILFAFFTSAA